MQYLYSFSNGVWAVDLACVVCESWSSESNPPLLFCCSCGNHYHGSCLKPTITPTPVVRAGWQCPDCKSCQVREECNAVCFCHTFCCINSDYSNHLWLVVWFVQYSTILWYTSSVLVFVKIPRGCFSLWNFIVVQLVCFVQCL